jgi:hypothetical protein
MICPRPSNIVDPRSNNDRGFSRMFVGCGRCGACKHNKRVEWSFRLFQEAKHSHSIYFTTLTYHESVIPLCNGGDDYTLKYEDAKEFIDLLRKKQLRKKRQSTWPFKFRYFLIGEYGGKFGRPHYHILFFNLNPDLIEVEFQRTWGMGITEVSKLNDRRINYATKFHVLANNGLRGSDFETEVSKEFTTMSRNPGIGYQYIKTHKKVS